MESKIVMLIIAQLAELAELSNRLTQAELAGFSCKYCGRTFSDGRRLGGHVRQVHPIVRPSAVAQHPTTPSADGEAAARVLELWKNGDDPLTIVSVLRVHPRFVKEVLKEFDELVIEWRKFKEA
jgi:hypothetical protein